MADAIFLNGMIPGQMSEDGTGIRFGFKTDNGEMMLEANFEAVEEIIYRLQKIAAEAMVKREGDKAAAKTPLHRLDRPRIRYLVAEDAHHVVMEVSHAGKPPVTIPLDEADLDATMRGLKNARDALRAQQKRSH